ncbi:hypothetical protein [Streptomyces sp. NPDC051997]|uniref:hypothetical protein n=1 Tax=Streptomyces sp. NPDC051997 TaxID=3155611 RepID=UPI00341B4174
MTPVSGSAVGDRAPEARPAARRTARRGITLASSVVGAVTVALDGTVLTVAVFPTAGTLLALGLPGHKDTMSTVRGHPDDVSPARSGR